jgi:hypothetical protein
MFLSQEYRHVTLKPEPLTRFLQLACLQYRIVRKYGRRWRLTHHNF